MQKRIRIDSKTRLALARKELDVLTAIGKELLDVQKAMAEQLVTYLEHTEITDEREGKGVFLMVDLVEGILQPFGEITERLRCRVYDLKDSIETARRTRPTIH
jgi:hypothetical protein